jgi:hypothetical protein
MISTYEVALFEVGAAHLVAGLQVYSQKLAR